MTSIVAFCASLPLLRSFHGRMRRRRTVSQNALAMELRHELRRRARPRRAAGHRSARLHRSSSRSAMAWCSSKPATRSRTTATATSEHAQPFVSRNAVPRWHARRLVRVSRRLELRRSNETEIGGVEDSISGAEDLALGMKIALTPQECILPETAIILADDGAHRRRRFTADEVLPGFNYLYGWDINDDWSTGGSTGINGAIDDVTRRYVSGVCAVVDARPSWTDAVGSYTEWFVLVPAAPTRTTPRTTSTADSPCCSTTTCNGTSARASG